MHSLKVTRWESLGRQLANQSLVVVISAVQSRDAVYRVGYVSVKYNCV